MIVREGIIEVLKATGAYHADDLDHLGIPDEHRNIIGSQTAKLVNQKWIEEAGRRKSILPSRNGAKSGIYRLTALGKNKIAGVPTAARASSAKVCTGSGDSGEAGLTGPGSGAGVANPQGPPAPHVPPSAGTASPEPVQRGRDRQVRGAGSSVEPDEGSRIEAPGRSAAADSQPARLSEPLSLLPEPDPESWAA